MSEIETKREEFLSSFQMPRAKQQVSDFRKEYCSLSIISPLPFFFFVHKFCSVREISSLQETLQHNPTLVQQIISSPKMMKLLQDHVMLRYIIESNPQIQSIMEARPEIGKLLRNPEVLTSMYIIICMIYVCVYIYMQSNTILTFYDCRSCLSIFCYSNEK